MGTSAVGLIFATTWRGQSPLHPVDLIEACQLGAGQIQARTRSFDPPPPPGKEAGRFASKKDRLIVRLVVLSVVRPANPQPALVGSYREVSRAPLRLEINRAAQNGSRTALKMLTFAAMHCSSALRQGRQVPILGVHV